MTGDFIFYRSAPAAQGMGLFSLLQADETNFIDSDTDPLIFGFLIVLGFSLVVVAPMWAAYFRQKRRQKKLRETLMDRSWTFHDMLNVHIHYYRLLPEIQKRRFMQRVVTFMQSKQFRYVNIEKTDEMPLLVSAAAVQLTFGLEEYLLDHFRVIYILKEDYRYGAYSMPFMGHVDSSGIYLSWNNFLRGFENYSDAHNVGIHEMAHALAYVNFMSDNGHDDHFRAEFRNFSKIARPIFNRMQQGEINLLDGYAATNYNEFWAVCAETFFEKPRQMCDQLPDLYEAMTGLLRQNPLEWMESEKT